MREEQCDERYRNRICCWNFDVLAGALRHNRRFWKVVAVMKTTTFKRELFYATITLAVIGLALMNFVTLERIVQ